MIKNYSYLIYSLFLTYCNSCRASSSWSARTPPGRKNQHGCRSRPCSDTRSRISGSLPSTYPATARRNHTSITSDPSPANSAAVVVLFGQQVAAGWSTVLLSFVVCQNYFVRVRKIINFCYFSHVKSMLRCHEKEYFNTGTIFPSFLKTFRLSIVFSLN